ncbi:MAG: threonine synthase [Candidatus Aenigmarchaeota archaeon]|nr:threonine synthase [Candidatus Aenigmarchaeota archaeon]
MFASGIRCPACGRSYPLAPRWRCACLGNLEIQFDYRGIRKRLRASPLRGRAWTHDRYRDFFPVHSLVTLGEGCTPLLPGRNMGKELGLSLFFKNESANPTASFKDRGSAVEVGAAVEARAQRVVCASTGNMGASVAAYAAVAGLHCTVYVPADARVTKLRQIQAAGAKLVRVRGGYTRAAALAEARSPRSFLLGDYLYRREGTKSVGYELAEQLQPAWVIVPVGNGVLMAAVWKAFREFRDLGLLRRLPRLIAVQAAGSSTVADALLKHHTLHRLAHARTVALAIEVDFPLDGLLARQAVEESRGFAVTVTDREILRARDLLLRREGLFAEPAGAAGLAGLLKIHDRLPQGSRVACLVTGHGLKDPFPAARRQ